MVNARCGFSFKAFFSGISFDSRFGFDFNWNVNSTRMCSFNRLVLGKATEGKG